MDNAIGIEFGLHNCRVAILDGCGKLKILNNRENKPQTPSVVVPTRIRHNSGDDRDETYVGESALDNWENAPEDTILSVRRLMGRSVTDWEVKRVRETFLYQVVEPADGTKDSVRVVMNGKLYSPVEISAMIFRKLKDDAEFRLGKEVTHAVITAPAYFSRMQRGAIWRAANLGGLKMLRILAEPTAATTAMGLDFERGEEPKIILVYDLGSTFDTSVLMWAGSNFVQLNTEGDMWLGGDDFDQVIVDKAVKYISGEYVIDARQNKSCMAILKKQARAAKERLSVVSSTELILTGLRSAKGDLIDVDMEITRQEFERMVKPLVDRTIRIMENTLSNAFVEARMTGNGRIPPIDYVLVTGGSTKMPIIRRTLQDIFGAEKLLNYIEAEYCVAMGAAILAATLDRVICWNCETANEIDAVKCSACGELLQFDNKPEESARQVFKGDDSLEIGLGAPFAYGIQSEGDNFNKFIEKNEPYPTPEENIKTLPFTTRTANQRMIKIPVYGGEKQEKASANEKQGEAFVVLPAGLPRGTVVRIKLWLDANGIFDLSAHLENGTALRPWIIHGELDHKAVEEFDELQEELNKWEKNATPEQLEKIEKTVAEAYELLEERKIENVIGLVKQILEKLKQGSGEMDRTESS